jgi:hypothetical protein
MTTNLDPQPWLRTSDGLQDARRWHGFEHLWVFNPRAGYSQDEADYR